MLGLLCGISVCCVFDCFLVLSVSFWVIVFGVVVVGLCLGSCFCRASVRLLVLHVG